MRTSNNKMLFISIILAVPAMAQQDFDLTWHTIDGGGAMFTRGGEFELSGTIGQPDAGGAAGGEFTLLSGFWPATASSGDGCRGRETIRKATCKAKKGVVKKVVVKVKGAAPSREYTARLDTGQQVSIRSKPNGKLTFKFKGDDRPECGDNGVTVCDGYEPFSCGC